jgi:DNA segregation ATPase FtsK/SpoIIIE, S-DNA-T family
VAGSTVSRRVREFIGVALFAAALIWLIALATYEPSDPVWFFSAGSAAAPANFAGRVGAFLAELSFQLLGYASYVIPAAMVIIGWHYFWCRKVDAQYTKLVGAVLLFGCLSSLLSLAFGRVDAGGKPFRAGGYVGEGLASWMAEYLNRTGSIIVILTLFFLAAVLSTQLSLGRMFSSATEVSRSSSSRIVGMFRGWLDERRRARQRKTLL